jgi:positive regulator of sigma E activity
MVVSAAGMKEKDAFAVRLLLYMLGLICIAIGLYVLFKIYLPQHSALSLFVPQHFI